jgi:hypothetical protein
MYQSEAEVRAKFSQNLGIDVGRGATREQPNTSLEQAGATYHRLGLEAPEQITGGATEPFAGLKWHATFIARRCDFENEDDDENEDDFGKRAPGCRIGKVFLAR